MAQKNNSTGELTARQKRDYVANAGKSCPHCGQSNLEAGSRDSDGGVMTQEVACLDCHRGWTDVFTLTGIQEPRTGQ